MSGSGSRDGFGSPPWEPAEPVPELEDTQVLPGLGATGQRGPSGPQSPRSPGGPPELGRRPGAEPADGQARLPAGTFRPPATDSSRLADGAGTPPGDGAGTRPGDGAGQQRGRKPSHRRPRKRRSFWRELPVLIVVALVLALVIKTYAIQAFYIPSASMENTLEIGDRVLINKLVYHFRGIHRGDIIVFDGDGSWDPAPPGNPSLLSRFWSDLEGIVGVSHDSDIYIKRVIGLPGDHVACCNAKGQVTVNGVPLNETSYLYPGNVPSTLRFNITVPPGRLWVMGDHRFVSDDSRGHMGDPGGGTIPESAVLGRAFVIIWPPSQWGFLNIPATFEQPQLNASAAAAGGSSAALAAAMDNGTPLRPAGSALPLVLGFAGAVPLTLLQRVARRRARLRMRMRMRRARRRR